MENRVGKPKNDPNSKLQLTILGIFSLNNRDPTIYPSFGFLPPSFFFHLKEKKKETKGKNYLLSLTFSFLPLITRSYSVYACVRVCVHVRVYSR